MVKAKAHMISDKKQIETPTLAQVANFFASIKPINGKTQAETMQILCSTIINGK